MENNAINANISGNDRQINSTLSAKSRMVWTDNKVDFSLVSCLHVRNKKAFHIFRLKLTSSVSVQKGVEMPVEVNVRDAVGLVEKGV
jgi:hypothetical protein